MPLFKYRCAEHGDFEREHKSGNDLKQCDMFTGHYEDDPKGRRSFETCGKPLQKLINFEGGIKFIGKGFYSNDSKPRTNK